MAVDVPDDAVCSGCGYMLRGLPGPTCPECGRPFDPRDPLTFRLPVDPRTKRLRRVTVATIAAAFGLLLVPSCECACGYMGWESFVLTVPVAALAWFALIRNPSRNLLFRALLIVIAALSVLGIAKNVADVLWFGHDPVFTKAPPFDKLWPWRSR